MNEKSLEKIQSAADFLSQFHHTLSEEMQAFVRPHLAQPYQSALKILDCFETEDPVTVDYIVEKTSLSKPTVRQLLRTLQQSGVIDAAHTVKTWQKTPPEAYPSSQNSSTPESSTFDSNPTILQESTV